MVAGLTLFPLVTLPMRSRFPNLHCGGSPTKAVPRCTSHTMSLLMRLLTVCSNPSIMMILRVLARCHSNDHAQRFNKATKMAQQNRECTNLETDGRSSCCCPIAMVAGLALFPLVRLPMRSRLPKLHSGGSPTDALPHWKNSHTPPLPSAKLHRMCQTRTKHPRMFRKLATTTTPITWTRGEPIQKTTFIILNFIRASQTAIRKE